MKEIYSFNVEVDRQVIEEVTKKRKNKKTGKMEEYTEEKSVTKPVPVKIILKEPNRREMEEADIEYSIEMSKCIKKGILTKAMLAKKYSDSGGLLSEDDARLLTRQYGKLGDLQNKYSRLSAKTKKESKDQDRLQELLGEMADVRKNIVEMESSYSSLFNHTADSKAQNKVILWYLVNLSFYQENESDEILPFFSAEESEDKIDQFYELDESGNEIFDIAKDKVSAILSFWYFSTNATKEDFDAVSEDIDSGNV